MRGPIWDPKNGEQLAWIENGEVFSAPEGKEKVATVREWQLHSLNGEPLGIYLQPLNVGGQDGHSARDGQSARAAIRKLCGFTEAH